MNNQSILVENVPSDWVIKKIKYVFDERKETNDPIQTDVLVSLTHDRGVILHSEKGDIGNKEKDDIKKYKIVHPGDIVVNSMNVIIGSSGLSDYFGLVSPVYYMLVKKDPNHDNKFFHYLFRSIVFQKSLIGVGNGILEHRMRIPIDQLGGQLIPLPSANEQKLISRYLDKKTSQIDSLVEKIQKKIELLKEQRTSLINHYVTKGLDSNVEMKDSGIEWIGELPKHWKVKKLKHIVSNKGLIRGPFGGALKVDSFVPHGYKVYEQKNAIYNDFTLGTSFINEDKFEELNRFSIIENDILMSCSGTIGKTALVPKDVEPGIINQALLIIRIQTSLNILPEYIQTVFSSSSFQEQVIDNSQGGAMKNLVGIDIFRNVKIPLPNQTEQTNILKNIKIKSAVLDKNINIEEKRIELLKEYRQSLISSVVTGKVRVTEDMI